MHDNEIKDVLIVVNIDYVTLMFFAYWVSLSKFSECNVSASLGNFYNTFPKNCGLDESLGITAYHVVEGKPWDHHMSCG